jgi:hypothetical protein
MVVSLLNKLFSTVTLECMNDFQIYQLWLAGTVSWKKNVFQFSEKCCVLQVKSTLINEKVTFFDLQ